MLGLSCQFAPKQRVLHREINKNVMDGNFLKLKGFLSPLTSFKTAHILTIMCIPKEHTLGVCIISLLLLLCCNRTTCTYPGTSSVCEHLLHNNAYFTYTEEQAVLVLTLGPTCALLKQGGDEGIYDLCACVIKLKEMERNQVQWKLVMAVRRREGHGWEGALPRRSLGVQRQWK